MSAAIVHICIPHSGRDHYDYQKGDLTVQLGARVEVDFCKRRCVGMVVGFSDQSAFSLKLKPLLAVLDLEPVVSEGLLYFYRWVSRYYHAPFSSVLQLALPKQFRAGKPCVETPLASSEAASFPAGGSEPLSLTTEQSDAVKGIIATLGRYQCILLYGITGSGKTEVYLQAMEAVLQKGQQVLVLVPEIGLTPQLISRVVARFSTPVVVLHSHLSDAARYRAWQQAVFGKAGIVLGTRTALFTPLPALGLIVIDEEHDASFKQQEGVWYSARDAALVRAQQTACPVILGSATPSLDTYLHMMSGKYHCYRLTRSALAVSRLQMACVDLRNQPLKEGLAESTYQAIERHIAAGNQVLVFINRRGFSPVLLCHACGWIADCTACDGHLTVHQTQGHLRCHHCGAKKKLIAHCEACHQPALVCVGVGTQRLFQALKKRLPNTAIAQVDRDALRQGADLAQTLTQIAEGHIQLMVGTQLLAKGHHFPRLTLVVVADGDAGLYHQDFRALERLGQLLLQVAGRAGRAEQAGEVLIQTHFPHHPFLTMLLAEGYDAFAQALLAQRQQAQLPPYQRMGMIRAKGRVLENVEQCLCTLKHALAAYPVRVLGPAPAAMLKQAGYYRMQLTVTAEARNVLHEALYALKGLPKMKGASWTLEIDPV